MSGVNKAIIIGNVGSDPESKRVGESTVANFSVATSEKYKDKETTEWHRIVVWGKLAEIVAQYVRKGSLVCVEGKIQTREWEGKDGSKQRTTEINASQVTFLGKRKEGGGGTEQW
jgi:single-strand DNA-binding protein